MLKIFSARRIRRDNELSRLENEKTALEIDRKYMATVEAVLSPNPRDQKTLEDVDEAEWTDTGQDEKRLTAQDYINLRDQAQKLYNTNVHARNIVRLGEKYVVGRGFAVTPKSTLEDVKDYWDNFWKVNKMAKRKKEIMRRLLRDGELFIRYFKKDGVDIIRFMNPALVKEPDDGDKAEGAIGSTTHGIETDHEDIETVLAYWYNGVRVPAEDVDFHKIFADSDEKRGRSWLEVVAQDLAYYEKWRKDRIKLNTVRAAVGLVRTVKGSPTQTANIADGYRTTKRVAPDGSYLARAPEAVSMWTVNQGVDLEMMSPNLQAADVQHDGRSILLAVAAGAGLPEYMVTSDSSNANYASTMVAEAPGIREFYDWQDYAKSIFSDMFERIIGNAVADGTIPAKETRPTTELKTDETTGQERFEEVEETVDTEIDADIVFPELVHRDVEIETKAYTLQKQNNWISDRTAQIRLDLDPDEENEQIRKEDQDREERETFTEETGDDFEQEREEEMKGEKEPVTAGGNGQRR